MVRFSNVGTVLTIVCVCSLAIVLFVWALYLANESFEAVLPVKREHRSEQDWHELSNAWHMVMLAGVALGVPGVILFNWAFPITTCLALIVGGGVVIAFGYLEGNQALAFARKVRKPDRSG